MMKYVYICILMLPLIYSNSFAQNRPTKSQLIKAFRASIDQRDKKVVSVGSGQWTICDQDSAYFKADTIQIYSDVNYLRQFSQCCDFVNWMFYKEGAFVRSTSQTCKEPSTSDIKGQKYITSIIKQDKKLLLILVSTTSAFEFFEVVKLSKINLADNRSVYVITLKRTEKYGAPIIGPLH